MLETKEQKQIFAGSVILLIILGLVSFWHRPDFVYKDTTDYGQLGLKSKAQQQQTADYLASLGTTEEAQKAIVAQILPQDQLQAEVEKALDSNQTITVPTILDSQIKIASTGGKAALQNYLNQSGPLFDKLKTVTDSAVDDIYNPTGSQNKIDSLIIDASTSLSDYQKISVPKEAVNFHKQLIVALETYVDLLKSSRSYMEQPAGEPWPQMYKDYVIINKTLADSGTEFKNLNLKYNLLGVSAQNQPVAKGTWLVPAATAQIATVDIWAKAQQALQEVAATSIARFMLLFLDKLANKIESSYRISNFLYYTDALVSGQYVDDYLNKYVGNALDKTMVKNFISQVSCGNTKDYSQVFQAKADQYLGFDPDSVDPSDPDYYQKLAKVGNFLSSPQGWQIHYQEVAAQAQAAAEQAANNELVSSGHKAGRNETGSIITPVEESIGAMRAIFQRYLQEGSSTSGFTTTQKITSEITQGFLNNFVLKGVVLADQKTCIAVPQLQLVTQVAP